MIAAPFLLTLAALAAPLPVAIVHGSPVGTLQPIHQALVRILSPEGKTGCTGTLVASRVVVTAGHCVRSGFGAAGSVVEAVARPGLACSRAVSIEAAYAPGAEPDGILMLPDLALVLLDRAPCGTVPASLPSGALGAGDEVTTAGFGVGAADPLVPEQLALRLLPQTREAIVAEYADENADWQRMAARDFDKYSPFYLFALPARDYGTVCGGDSGGPVFREDGAHATILAENGAFIVHPSKGIPACDGAYLQLFTPLGPYVAWIRGWIGKWSP